MMTKEEYKPDPSNYVIEVVGLRKVFTLSSGIQVTALKGINLKVRRGEYLTVMGPSGSGKTTLFNMIGGLDRPTEGKVYIDGKDLSTFSDKELSSFRSHKIGYIFQTYNLIPTLTALDNVALPMVFAGVDREEREKKARELLERVGLGERINHLPTELSGGQQQRVAIARALANDPALILADEPTANLDLSTGLEIIDLLKQLNRETGATVITNTHDLKVIDVSDRIAWLSDGQFQRIEDKIEVEIGPQDVTIPY
ncbi:ABC transporter ATP-binding protein [Tardisphaera miroshnichenkoae]